MKQLKKLLYLVVLLTFITGLFIVPKIISKKINLENLQVMLQDINDTCNEALATPVESEAKYMDLFEKEEDPFTKGKYASVLVGINAFNGNSDGIVKYGSIAVDNYRKIPGGDLFAVSESKYIAWSMVRIGRYSDAFVACNDLMDIINNDKYTILSKSDILDIEALVYSIYLTTYCEFNIKDKAETYYNMLLELPMNDELRMSKGDEMYYSLIQYAYLTDNYELTKKYSIELYEIQKEIDLSKGISMADTLLINIGISDILLGNFEEGIEKVKEAEKIFMELNNEYSLHTVYDAYFNYYAGKNDPKAALSYLYKRLELLKKHNDSLRYNDCLKITIDYINKTNISMDLTLLYKEFFDSEVHLRKNDKVSDLLSTTLTINNELNKSKLSVLEKINTATTKSTVIFITATVILLVLLNRLRKLYIVKAESEKKLSELVKYDYLTKTFSRSHGYDKLNDLIKSNIPFSIAMIDIDNFKNINDTYGHDVGDKVLIELGNIFNSNLQKDDFILRTGGEEFIIALVNKDKNTSIELLKKYSLLFSKTKFQNDLYLSFSTGIAERKDESLDSLIIKADRLLYKAKENGKNLIL